MIRTILAAAVAIIALNGPVHGRSRQANKPAALTSRTAPVVIVQPVEASPGSLYSGSGRLADLARDLRASQVHDIITIVVSDNSSAVTTGTTNSSRKSSAANSIASLAVVAHAVGPWASLANLSSAQQLQGNATTTRQSTLSTTVSAEVGSVMANGNLVIEGRKEIAINGENQVVIVRGVIRADDVSPTNTVASAQIAGLQISVNGKGVVGDAVRRPFILYRILLGLLPF